MRRRASIQTADKLMNFFWPDFKEVDGLVLLSWVYINPVDPKNFQRVMRKKSTYLSIWMMPLPDERDDTGTEWICNHTHMIDIFNHHAGRTPTPDNDIHYDYDHPDFELLCKVGKQIAHLWFLKLKQDFPQYRFRVYYTQYDNPIVRFHRVRDNEPNWLSEEAWKDEIKNGTIIVFDTGGGKLN